MDLSSTLFFKRIPFVTVVHHLYHPLRSKGLIYLFDKWSSRIFLQSADLILVISDNTKYEVERLVNGKSIHKVYFPLTDIKDFDFNKLTQQRKKNKQTRLLLVGNCIPRKRIELVFPVLKALGERVHLDVIGETQLDKKYWQRLTNEINALNLKNITFHGWLSRESLQKFYEQANLFLFPSLWEGFGIVLLEAMLWSLPIISTPAGAIPELVKDRQNGFLVDPTNSTVLIERLKQLIDEPELQIQMGKKGRELACNYLEKSKASYELLSQLVNARLQRSLFS